MTATVRAPVASSVLARCACGLAYDLSAWRVLPYVGLQEDGDDEILELRNCSCGSTLAVAHPSATRPASARSVLERAIRNVEIITEAEIMAGFHDFVHDYEKKTATCSRCGRECHEVMNSRSPRCAGKKKDAKADEALSRKLRHRARIEHVRRETIERAALVAERILAPDSARTSPPEAMLVANAIRALARG